MRTWHCEHGLCFGGIFLFLCAIYLDTNFNSVSQFSLVVSQCWEKPVCPPLCLRSFPSFAFETVPTLSDRQWSFSHPFIHSFHSLTCVMSRTVTQLVTCDLVSCVLNWCKKNNLKLELSM